MAVDAQSLEVAAAAGGFSSLSDRDLLMCILWGLATTPGAGTTAQTAITGATAQGYYKMSERDLMEAILVIVSGGP